MDKIYSMSALGMNVFVSVSNDVIPNDEESFDSDILQSIWLKIFKRVCLVALNMGMRRRKSRSIQYPSHSYKMNLNNFGYCTWICACVNDLTL